MANGRGRGRHAKKIQTVHWQAGAPVNVVGIASAGISGVNLLAAQHLPETILRMRGEWMCAFNGALGTASGARLVAGMILVPDGTGSTVTWSPIADSDAPWIWYDVIHLDYQEYVVDAVQSAQASSARRLIDSKAMRVNRNQELQFVVENEDPGTLSGQAANVLAHVRVLSGS